jgi:hypothetical protein
VKCCLHLENSNVRLRHPVISLRGVIPQKTVT